MHEIKLTDNLVTQFNTVLGYIPFNKTLGLQLDAIYSDHIILHFDMQPHLIGNFLQGILHGGVIASVLDMAGGAAAMLSIIQKNPKQEIKEYKDELSKVATINLHIDYLRPGTGNQFIAKALNLRSGNKISVNRMELYNQDQTLIATGTGTYLIA